MSMGFRAGNLQDSNDLLREALAFSQRPGADTAPLGGADAAESPAPVSEITAPDEDHFYLIGEDVPAPPAGLVYGIWLSDGTDLGLRGDVPPSPGDDGRRGAVRPIAVRPRLHHARGRRGRAGHAGRTRSGRRPPRPSGVEPRQRRSKHGRPADREERVHRRTPRAGATRAAASVAEPEPDHPRVEQEQRVPRAETQGLLRGGRGLPVAAVRVERPGQGVRHVDALPAVPLGAGGAERRPRRAGARGDPPRTARSRGRCSRRSPGRAAPRPGRGRTAPTAASVSPAAS